MYNIKMWKQYNDKNYTLYSDTGEVHYVYNVYNTMVENKR